MSQTATRDLKSVGSEITQWENRAEVVKTEVERLNQTRDALSAQIDKKSSDFNVYMSQKDAEIKRERAALVADREQFSKDKAAFQEILVQHKNDKAALENQKRDLDIQKLRHEASKKNVQEFTTAVRRAVGLLGI